MKKIFVVIVTYKGKYWYDRCFQSLRKSTYPVTTIVVDNNSNDGSVEYIRKQYPEVMVFENKENLGFGSANNVGMKFARENGCDYVFLLNQDTWIEADMMERLVQIAEKHPGYGVYSPLHLSAEGDSINMRLVMSDLPGFMNDCFLGKLKEIYKISYSNAAGWLIPRHTLETIGGFTPLIYHYGEDDDYMRRMVYHGLDMALVPSARMTHDSGKKLDNAEELSLLSNTFFPEDYVNPAMTDSMCCLQRRFLFKALARLLHGDKKNCKGYMNRFRYVTKHKKEIVYYRDQNRIKQPNWIQ